MLSEEAGQTLDMRFWYTGASTIGLEGDVWFYLEPRVRIEEAHVVTSVREGTITVETEARNESQTRFARRVAWQITRSGQTELELPACEIDVAPGEVQMVRVSAPWHHPVQWGRPPYGEPVLYFLRATLGGGGQPVHETVVRFGFREVWVEGDCLLLNGDVG